MKKIIVLVVLVLMLISCLGKPLSCPSDFEENMFYVIREKIDPGRISKRTDIRKVECIERYEEVILLKDTETGKLEWFDSAYLSNRVEIIERGYE